jgi:hypothetical protein
MLFSTDKFQYLDLDVDMKIDTETAIDTDRSMDKDNFNRRTEKLWALKASRC